MITHNSLRWPSSRRAWRVNDWRGNLKAQRKLRRALAFCRLFDRPKTFTYLISRFGAFGEIAGVVVPETNSESYFSTVGITYNPRASLVFDLGLLTGWNDEAPDTQIYIGFTHNLGGHSWK